ncbi:uncharacterized protein [Nicotiana tomentosiformis]|uniref:uncharacterized protein n=1 Tax=Nicotiana tomentosiformis TaxID=4098 RepID=UPI00388CB749
MQALRDELKENDDELVKSIKNCSGLEGMLRIKEEELERSKGVKAQCSDLQAQVVELHRQLEEWHPRLWGLMGEVAEKQRELEKAESLRVDAQRRLEVLELANSTLRDKQDNDQFAAKAKEERLHGRVRELEKDNTFLHGQVVALEVEKAQLLAQPSSSHTSEFPNIPRASYEE